MSLLPPVFNCKKWIDEHRHLLKPPVGNYEVYPNHEFIIMVVGGPNSRTDYHVDPAEEFFYMLEGDMTLKVVVEGAIKDVDIREGEIFLLPAFIPHSPQRRANSIGLVVERARKALETDMFQWYCEKCASKLYEEKLQMTDIVKQLPPIFERYEAKVENRTCRDCAWVMPTRAESAAALAASASASASVSAKG